MLPRFRHAGFHGFVGETLEKAVYLLEGEKAEAAVNGKSNRAIDRNAKRLGCQPPDFARTMAASSRRAWMTNTGSWAPKARTKKQDRATR